MPTFIKYPHGFHPPALWSTREYPSQYGRKSPPAWPPTRQLPSRQAARRVRAQRCRLAGAARGEGCDRLRRALSAEEQSPRAPHDPRRPPAEGRVRRARRCRRADDLRPSTRARHGLIAQRFRRRRRRARAACGRACGHAARRRIWRTSKSRRAWEAATAVVGQQLQIAQQKRAIERRASQHAGGKR